MFAEPNDFDFALWLTARCLEGLALIGETGRKEAYNRLKRWYLLDNRISSDAECFYRRYDQTFLRQETLLRVHG